ncbi:hypothetical protein Tco_0809392 [Tanacetum coccineum]
MHIRNDPSFFLTNKTGAPQGEDKDWVYKAFVAGSSTPREVLNIGHVSSSVLLLTLDGVFQPFLCCGHVAVRKKDREIFYARLYFCVWFRFTRLWDAETIFTANHNDRLVGFYNPWPDGQPFAIICTVCRPGLCSASYSVVVGFDCSWKDHHTFFSFLPDVQHRHGSFHPSTLL